MATLTFRLPNTTTIHTLEVDDHDTFDTWDCIKHGSLSELQKRFKSEHTHSVNVWTDGILGKEPESSRERLMVTLYPINEVVNSGDDEYLDRNTTDSDGFIRCEILSWDHEDYVNENGTWFYCDPKAKDVGEEKTYCIWYNENGGDGETTGMRDVMATSEKNARTKFYEDMPNWITINLVEE